MNRAKISMAMLALFAGFGLGGCFKTVIINGKQPLVASVENESLWRHGFLYGSFELEGIDLVKRCPGGWARLKTEQSYAASVVARLTEALYTPLNATIECAAR